MSQFEESAVLSPASHQGNSITLPVSIVANDETPSLYVNVLEVAQTPHEFAIFVGRAPTRITLHQVDEAKAVGSIQVEALTQLLIAPTAIPGLIRSLLAQKSAYEAQFGQIFDQEKSNVG